MTLFRGEDNSEIELLHWNSRETDVRKNTAQILVFSSWCGSSVRFLDFPTNLTGLTTSHGKRTKRYCTFCFLNNWKGRESLTEPFQNTAEWNFVIVLITIKLLASKVIAHRKLFIIDWRSKFSWKRKLISYSVSCDDGRPKMLQTFMSNLKWIIAVTGQHAERLEAVLCHVWFEPAVGRTKNLLFQFQDQITCKIFLFCYQICVPVQIQWSLGVSRIKSRLWTGFKSTI